MNAVIPADADGAKMPDCFDRFLARDCNDFGFVEESRASWADKPAPEGWNDAKNGRPDIVFFEFPDGLSHAPDDARARHGAARSE